MLTGTSSGLPARTSRKATRRPHAPPPVASLHLQAPSSSWVAHATSAAPAPAPAQTAGWDAFGDADNDGPTPTAPPSPRPLRSLFAPSAPPPPTPPKRPTQLAAPWLLSPTLPAGAAPSAAAASPPAPAVGPGRPGARQRAHPIIEFAGKNQDTAARCYDHLAVDVSVSGPPASADASAGGAAAAPGGGLERPRVLLSFRRLRHSPYAFCTLLQRRMHAQRYLAPTLVQRHVLPAVASGAARVSLEGEQGRGRVRTWCACCLMCAAGRRVQCSMHVFVLPSCACGCCVRRACPTARERPCDPWACRLCCALPPLAALGGWAQLVA